MTKRRLARGLDGKGRLHRQGDTVTAALAALALLVAPPSHAEPAAPWSDPHFPDPMHHSCAGGMGGFIVGFCDGEHYADGTYWHQLSGSGWGSTPECLLNGAPAPVGGCDGAVKVEPPAGIPSP